MSVESVVATFANFTGKGAFPNLSHAQVLLGIRNRLANPDMMDQGSASLCGPASFLYCLIKDDPEAWVTYVTELYMKGNARIRSLEVKPSRDCLNANPGGIKPVDWVALASLRDSENTFFDYQDSSNEVGGISMPNTLASWFQRAGYRGVVNNTNVFFTKGADTLKSALMMSMSSRVCLFVDADMVNKPNSQGGTFTTANHWIVLTGGTGIQGDKLNMKIWTWGKTRNFIGFDTSRVVSNFYGYVAATPSRGS
jgi:hypothetical protein